MLNRANIRTALRGTCGERCRSGGAHESSPIAHLPLARRPAAAHVVADKIDHLPAESSCRSGLGLLCNTWWGLAVNARPAPLTCAQTCVQNNSWGLIAQIL